MERKVKSYSAQVSFDLKSYSKKFSFVCAKLFELWQNVDINYLKTKARVDYAEQIAYPLKQALKFESNI
jgi:hypothetical protein